MDADAVKDRLESELRSIEEWLAHPLYQQTSKEVQEEIQSGMTGLLNVPIQDIASVVQHIELRGYINGLKRREFLFQSRLEEIKAELEEYGN